MRLNYVMALMAAALIGGCQSVPDSAQSKSQPEIQAIELEIDESEVFDPTAIVRELGEAEDSPRSEAALAQVEDELSADIALEAPSETESPVEQVLEDSSPLMVPAEQSIWGDIASAFSFPELKDSRYADLHRDRLTHSDRFFSDFLAKADLYLPYVWQEVNARGMPGEIALLPFVESAYSPWAVSRAGAVGMWQIMPGTARVLNLDLGKTCDQRRDVIHSTRAALDYLQQMHAKFDDWLLAIAAYNAGPGRIERAIRANKKAGKPTDFWSLSLPRETRRYVPRLLVTRDLIVNAQAENIALPDIDAEIPFRVLQLEAPMEVSLVQELSGLSLAEIRRYNPCIRSWITPAKAPYQLILPTERAQEFSTALVSVSIRDYIRTKPYVIQKGDSLSSIASRTGSTVAELMTLNGMQNTRIVAGRTLRVPSTDENILQQLAALELGGGNGETMRYQVRSGDSLWKIAQRFRTSVDRLRQVNGASNLIRPGDWLTIPVR